MFSSQMKCGHISETWFQIQPSSTKFCVFSSIQNHGVPAREILMALGEMGAVGGQEDMIEDVALEIKKKSA